CRRRHTRSKRDWSSDVCSSDLPGQWRWAWISLRAIGPVQASDITLEVEANGGEHLASFSVPLEVYSEELPELPIPHTHWFHADGLAHYYGDEVWSEGHWQSIDAFLGAARRSEE